MRRSHPPANPSVQLRCPLLRAVLGFMVLTFIHQTSQACSVPVFRYGLEHWQADPYRLLIVHRGALGAEAQSQVQGLHDATARANLSVQVVDLSQSPEPEFLKAWEAAGSPEKPWILLHAPRLARFPGLVWSGPLDAGNVGSILNSPARSSIVRHLADGESAVWALLESGDKASDDAAAKLLEARLAYLSTVMELPKLDEQDIRNGLVSLPPDGLRLSFSIVRVSRSDAAERVFVEMLLATEPDLKQVGEPIAFPIFGQGRALYALVGKGIRHETIDEAASFLIGSCSCQVKEQNPGADLLMSANWKGLIKDQSAGLADLPAATEIVGSMPEAVTISAQTQTAAESAATCCGIDSGTMKRLAPAAMLASLALVAAVWFALSRRKVAAAPEVKSDGQDSR